MVLLGAFLRPLAGTFFDRLTRFAFQAIGQTHEAPELDTLSTVGMFTGRTLTPLPHWIRSGEPLIPACLLEETQICTRVPNSTTALLGSRKYSTMPPALRLIAANSRSRQFAMPPPGVGTTASRLRK
jgi:hypothetical protein